MAIKNEITAAEAEVSPISETTVYRVGDKTFPSRFKAEEYLRTSKRREEIETFLDSERNAYQTGGGKGIARKTLLAFFNLTEEDGNDL